MTASITTIKRNRILKAFLAAIILIAVWEVIFLIVNKPLLVASPLDTVKRLFVLSAKLSFWKTLLNSLLHILTGFILGVAAGTLLACLTSKISFLYSLFKPVVNIIKATPVASFIILALVWMNKTAVPSFISFLMVLPIVFANVSSGIEQTDRSLLEMAKVFHFTGKQRLTKIYIPSVMPSFLAAVTTSLGFAWKAGVAAEVLATPRNSIGTELYNSKVYLETTDLFAWTAAVIILSIILEKIIVTLIKKIARKEKKSGD